MLQVKINKFGKNQVGMWCLGTIFSDDCDVTFDGLINFDKEYVVVEGNTYIIKSLKLRKDKKQNLQLTIAL